MAARAERRLQTVRNHLIPPSSGDQPPLLHQHPTASCELYRELEYSVMLPEKLDSGTSNVCRSKLSPLKLVSRFPDHPQIATLHDNFVHAVEAFRDNKYLGTRVREDGTIGEHVYWMCYGEVDAARSAIGSGLVKRGLTKGSCVGLYFINRPEWLVVDHACSAFSLVSVPLYDTLGPKAVEFVVKHVDAQAIFCTPQTLKNLQSFLSEVPSLRLIVVIGRVEGRMPTNGVEIVSYSELYNDGLGDPQPFRPPTPDDVATILYTSGTTSTPKGVVLSHGNLIANAAGTRMLIKYYPSDIHMSYLPLAHIYERVIQITVVYAGASSGFYQGDTKKLLEDMVAVRPTVFCGVPRLYNRIYDRVMNSVKASDFLNQRLFNVAYEAKKTALYNGERSPDIWDQLVFNKLKENLGGRVRLMISGASPLSPQVMDFLRVCFGCVVIEGYGMTEASGSVTYMDENDKLSGHVGSPNPSYEIKLVDVPEMEYTSNDQPHPRGEICLRGPSVFQGYYKDETKTREVIDDDGWLHTGDIGLWLPGGQLKIIDRKKNIFKLAQGEYISPEKIENVYARCKFVAQCFVYGESLKSALVAIVVVDHGVLKAWAAAQSIKFDDLKQLCDDHRTRAAVLAEMDAVAREAQLRGFEFAKAVKLELEPFSVENGLLTPTSKIKRPLAKEYFGKAIASLYDVLSASDASSHQI